jgi:hypothetical protein
MTWWLQRRRRIDLSATVKLPISNGIGVEIRLRRIIATIDLGFRVVSLCWAYPDIMNHPKALALFLGIFVVMPVLLFFGLRWVARRWLSARLTSEAAAQIKNSKSFAQMSPGARNYVAVAICMSSAVLGVVAIYGGWGSVSSIAFNVACPWFLAGSWLAGDFTREGLKRFNIPMSRIYEDAKQRKLAKTPPLARVMNSGGGIMVLAGIVSWFR